MLLLRQNGHYWRNCLIRNTSGGFHNTQSGDSSHLYSPLEVLPLPRVQSQDDNELYSNLVESVVNVRQLEGEFVDSVHVDKSEGVQGRIAKSKMWWFENLNMSLTVYIEVLSNGYKFPFVQIPDSCFIPTNNSALHEDEFVRGIEELLTKRCILEVDSPLYCCNLLTVVRGKTDVALGYRLESFGKQVSPVMQIQIQRFANLVGDV